MLRNVFMCTARSTRGHRPNDVTAFFSSLIVFHAFQEKVLKSQAQKSRICPYKPVPVNTVKAQEARSCTQKQTLRNQTAISDIKCFTDS